MVIQNGMRILGVSLQIKYDEIIKYLHDYFSYIIFLSIYQYYSSNKNAELKSYNRDNINEIINTKISNLPILNDDNNNVIEFNDLFKYQKKKNKRFEFT